MIEFALTDAQFAAAQKALAAEGVDMSAPTGTISRQGVTAAYTWAEGKLTIEIKHHPMFLPVSLIESKLRQMIQDKLNLA